jgi:hypothetical protein
MTNPMIKIVNTQTGEEIEREMDAAELAQWEADNAENHKRESYKAQAANEKAALLAKLGISADEAKLLLS